MDELDVSQENMKYTEITNSLAFLNESLQKRDEFIRECAEVLLSHLKGADLGFPADTVCLQGVSKPIEDTKSYDPRQLPTEYSDGRRGFRIRFHSEYGGYLSGVIVLVPWVFSVADDRVSAQIPGESETYQCDLTNPQSKTFIDSLANATAEHIERIICNMALDQGINREMGFHQINQEG